MRTAQYPASHVRESAGGAWVCAKRVQQLRGCGLTRGRVLSVSTLRVQVFTLDQLVTHLRKLLPSDDKAVSQEEKKAVEVPQGECVTTVIALTHSLSGSAKYFSA